MKFILNLDFLGHNHYIIKQIVELRIILNFQGVFIMTVIRTYNQKPVKIPSPFERIIRVLVAPDTQDIVKDVSVTHCVIAPHSKIDYHDHPGVEMLYITHGRGICNIGKEKFKLEPNVLMICPPKIKHDVHNLSDETLTLVAIFVPPETSDQITRRAERAAKQ